MNKEEVYKFLADNGIEYERTEHKAVFSMGEIGSVELPYPEYEAKNLFVRDDKKENYYLITVKGEKRVDLKVFQKQNGLRRLSFASAEDLMKYLKLVPGSVSPFGLLNDKACAVKYYLDDGFIGSKIGVHPNDNTATVWLESEDLVKLLKAHGSEVCFVHL